MVEQRYDLRGLKVWYIAIIVVIASALLSGVVLGAALVSSNENGPVTASLALDILVLGAQIAAMVGIYMIRAYSPRFTRAFQFWIISIISSIVGVIMLSMAVLGGGVLAIIGLLLIVVGVIFAAISTKNQLMGMRDIALQNENSVLAQKFATLWKLFLIAFIILFVSFAVYFVCWYEYIGGGILALSSLGVFIASIFMLVVQILWIIRAKALYVLYNGDMMTQ